MAVSPQWWVKAIRLDWEDRPEESERVIEKAMRRSGKPFLPHCAHLYELRSRRLHNEKKDAAAAEAADRANLLMQQYVASAVIEADRTAFSREAGERAKRMKQILATSNKPQEPQGWWAEALRLEKLGQLAEAEKVVKDALHPKGDPWDYQCAYLYELRAIRLHEEGNDIAAWDAARRSDELMWSYASSATSGGEGVAFSRLAEQAAERLQKVLRTPR